MATEPMKMAVAGNMHMVMRVMEVTELGFKVKSDLQGHLEASMASENIKVAIRLNMHVDFKVNIDLPGRSGCQSCLELSDSKKEINELPI